MTNSRGAEFDIGHPAPDRGRIGLGLLMFALSGAPIAWALQLLTGSSIAGLACLSPHGVAVETARIDWGNPVMIAVNIAALALAGLALVASIVILRRTGHESEGGHDSVMDAGEGRSRYIGIWGLWTSLLFIIAIAVNTISIFWSGLCAL